MNETEPNLVKCIGYLHAASSLRRGDPVPLQYLLEEALKGKFGLVKDYTDIVQSYLCYEDAKGGSNSDELELDLLKEDLMCVICNGMDVGARNRLLECSGCHSLYHQECHKPEVTEEDSFENWVCHNCKEASKKIKLSTPAASSSSNKSPKSSYRHSSHSSGSYKYSRSGDKK